MIVHVQVYCFESPGPQLFEYFFISFMNVFPNDPKCFGQLTNGTISHFRAININSGGFVQSIGPVRFNKIRINFNSLGHFPVI